MRADEAREVGRLEREREIGRREAPRLASNDQSVNGDARRVLCVREQVERVDGRLGQERRSHEFEEVDPQLAVLTDDGELPVVVFEEELPERERALAREQRAIEARLELVVVRGE